MRGAVARVLRRAAALRALASSSRFLALGGDLQIVQDHRAFAFRKNASSQVDPAASSFCAFRHSEQDAVAPHLLGQRPQLQGRAARVRPPQSDGHATREVRRAGAQLEQRIDPMKQRESKANGSACLLGIRHQTSTRPKSGGRCPGGNGCARVDGWLDLTSSRLHPAVVLVPSSSRRAFRGWRRYRA